MAWAGVHTAVIVGDFEAGERIFNPLADAVFADRLFDPIEGVDGFHLLGLVSLVPGLARQLFDRLNRRRVIGQIIFGFFEVVVAAIARRHYRIQAHLVGGNRHDARREIALQLGVNILDLHGAAAIPVLHLDQVEPEFLAECLGRAVVSMPGAFQGAARIVTNLLVFSAHDYS